MKTATRLLALSALASGAFFTTNALACSSSEWATTAAGATAGDPNMESIARVAGKCGLQVTGTGHVVDNTPDGETTFIARFYFFGKDIGAGTHTIFSAFSADAGGGTNQFNITYDGSNVAVDALGGGSASAAAVADKWNLVEVKWENGSTGSLWVNADAAVDVASDTFASGAGSIGSVQLGAVSNLANGDLAFVDDYVSHRSLAVGPELYGDANADGSINGGDINVVVNEFLNNQLADGVPDCNLDGAINGGDINCIVGIFLAP